MDPLRSRQFSARPRLGLTFHLISDTARGGAGRGVTVSRAGRRSSQMRPGRVRGRAAPPVPGFPVSLPVTPNWQHAVQSSAGAALRCSGSLAAAVSISCPASGDHSVSSATPRSVLLCCALVLPLGLVDFSCRSLLLPTANGLVVGTSRRRVVCEISNSGSAGVVSLLTPVIYQ